MRRSKKNLSVWNHKTELEDEVQVFVDGVTEYSLPASKERTEEYKVAQQQDIVCVQVRRYCESEWPDKKLFSPVLMPYYQVRKVHVQ